ncbi:CRISPR-associated helicase Cas3' [Streptomyces polygonati]|uniref:CRISPR-associated helicase Cas3 n=1 Tax=Streptomyces polygonati TaxID=1617087 RepID=A0ABV8HW44_9ACTN
MKQLRAKSPSTPGQPGELLTSHLLNTLQALLRIRDRTGDIPGTPPGFWTWAALACLLHDAGKLPDGFQRMIGNTNQQPVVWGERHEVLSLGFVGLLLADLPAGQRLWVATAIAGHHRSFTCGLEPTRKLPVFHQYGNDQPEDLAARFTPADQARLTELLEWLHTTARRFSLPAGEESPRAGMDELTSSSHQLLQELMDRWEPALPARDTDGRTAVLLLGAVTMADHLSSAHSPLHTRHPLTADYPTRLAKKLAERGHLLRPQQERAAQVGGHLLLRSWTGSGKTEAVLLWAVTQIADLSQRTRANPRVFYLLPYLASINAMAERLSTELDSPEGIGVAHSKAASYHLARALADGCPDTTATHDDPSDTADAAAKAHSRAEATRNFRELVRVGTPYQLLRGALAGPVHSSILTDSANSVFVLDELHAYDTRRLGMILAMIRLWHELGGHIAVMSATLPTALARLVETTLDHQVQLVEAPDDAPAPVRHRLHTRQAHLTEKTSRDEIRDHLTAGRSVLVVANNVRDAITLYQDLQPLCTQLYGPDSAYLLHSRYRRMDRTAIETGILRRFAAGQPRQPGLLVGTQALEVSLNIDLDVCHTSAADLEALIQRFGRVNRLGTLAPAPVIVHQPAYTTRRDSRPQLWADGVYEAIPTQLGWDILTRHDGQTIDEQIITGWLDEIYQGPWGERWKTNVEQHQHDFHQAFLTFTLPFDDRSHLARRFDEQFDGTEAVLADDRDHYKEALDQGPDKKTGRLHADQYLIPLPAWGTALTQYDKALNVRIIDADYDPQLGLLAIHRESRQTYTPGEVL